MKCFNCKGTGEVECTNFANEPQQTYIDTCRYCNGTGELDEEATQ